MDAELREKLHIIIEDEAPNALSADEIECIADALAPIIAEVEDAARADEREKAAKVASEHQYDEPDNRLAGAWNDACNDIAAAIRAQKEPSA